MKRSEAMRLRGIIEQAAGLLDDKTASEGAMLFPKLKGDGALIKAGTRINWNGAIKRAAVDLYDREDATPETAPTLWENIEYRGGYRIIPETITAGTAFAKDECGWWGDVLYKSKQDANNWTPAAYAPAWEKVTQ